MIERSPRAHAPAAADALLQLTCSRPRQSVAGSLLRGFCLLLLAVALLAGCRQEPEYGVERRLHLPAETQQVWAVAPAVNLSGQRGVDPLLQADSLFRELQSVRGIKAVPVNRTAEMYAVLGIDQIESPEQAQVICELLGVDGVIVPTVTIYDPYNPPKMGAAIQLFARDGSSLSPQTLLDMEEVRRLVRAARDTTAGLADPAPVSARFLQEAGLFDAAHGSTRDALGRYAQGRNDPIGPAAGGQVYLLSMDRFSGFVWHQLLGDLMFSLEQVQDASVAAGQVR